MSFTYSFFHWPKHNLTPGSKVSLKNCADNLQVSRHTHWETKVTLVMPIAALQVVGSKRGNVAVQ